MLPCTVSTPGTKRAQKDRAANERLKQTELAMSEILEQLSTISAEPTQAAVPQNLENAVVQKSKTNGESKKTDVDEEHYLRDLGKEEMDEDEGIVKKSHDGGEGRGREGGAGSVAEGEAENGGGGEREEKQEDDRKKGEDESLGPAVEQHMQQTRPHKSSKRAWFTSFMPTS
uniref:Uncharacterized protein n=1 Tax=Parascaris univalens TaxID=6257 RepID=A0A914ZX32_PARUN